MLISFINIATEKVAIKITKTLKESFKEELKRGRSQHPVDDPGFRARDRSRVPLLS